MYFYQGGSVPHLTKDVFKMISTNPQILSVSLPSTYFMIDSIKGTNNSLAEFVGMKVCNTIIINF